MARKLRQSRKRKCPSSSHGANLRVGLISYKEFMQQGKWQRKKNLREQIVKPELAIVADASGQTYRVSLQELVTGQHQVLMLYDKGGRLLCNKPKLGRGHERPKKTIARAEIRRVINPPNVEITTPPVLP